MIKNIASIFASCLVLVLTLGLFAEAASAQDLHSSRRPSPMGMARTHVGDAYVSVVYSRPYKRDRDNVFGTKEAESIVPFGEVWRTGANEATEITVTEDVKVAGKTLKAGTYSLFTTPGAENWKVHFNSRLEMWGIYAPDADGEFAPAYSADQDVLTITLPAGTTEEEVDQLTFSFEESDGGADLTLTWINTEVKIPFASAK